jgi:hypothetical protein
MVFPFFDFSGIRNPRQGRKKHPLKSDDFVKSPSVPLGAGLRFNFVVCPAKRGISAPHSSVFARFVPPVAGELFTKSSFRRLFTRSSSILRSGKQFPAKNIIPALPVKRQQTKG